MADLGKMIMDGLSDAGKGIGKAASDFGNAAGEVAGNARSNQLLEEQVQAVSIAHRHRAR